MEAMLLPQGVRVVWVAAFAYVIVSHLQHAAVMPGQRRWWHGTHVLMALGMAHMFLPVGLKGFPSVGWQALFTVAALAVAGWMVSARIRHRHFGSPWFDSLLGLAAMVYMFAIPGAAIAPLTYALVAYYLGDASAWAGGVVPRGQRARAPPPPGSRRSAQAQRYPVAGCPPSCV